MRRYLRLQYVFYALIFCAFANAYQALARFEVWRQPFLALFIVYQLFVGVLWPHYRHLRFRVVHHGATCLIAFVYALVPSLVYHIVLLVRLGFVPAFWFSLLFAAAAFFLLFWNGILSVYLASYQLGIHHRLLGIVCGLVPVLNLVMLRRIIAVVVNESDFELAHERRNDARQAEALCATKYPLLLVHGVFFRDWKHLNYWGRIPDELRFHGAEIYYGNHQSAAAVADSAAEIAARVRAIVAETDRKSVG